MVTNGVVRRNAQVRVVRDGTVIYETSIAQLKRFKDDVREVAEGFECGILLDGFNDVKEGDVLEATRRARSSAPTSRHRADPRRPSTLRARAWAPATSGSSRSSCTSPRAHSLEGEAEVHLRSVKAQLQNRFGASVAEVDHHDVWQRSRLTLSCVAREYREAERLLAEAER